MESLYSHRSQFVLGLNHIQIAIINPNCIKGFFLPRDVDDKFIIP